MINLNELHPVPCNIKVVEYDEVIGDYHIPKVAITVLEDEKQIMKILRAGEHSDSITVMYKEQFDNIFKPLFSDIRELNIKIKELTAKYTKF